MITVLLVDDEPALLDLTRLFLEQDPEISATTCSSASDALETLVNVRFDAIISDYEMPGINGIEFLQRFRQTGDLTPFCIFTGKGREHVAIEALNSGADFYLQKGGDPKTQFAELKNMVRQSVKRRQAELALAESEEKYRFLADYSLNAVMIQDFSGTILLANTMAANTVELDSPAAMIGRNTFEFIAPESQQQVIDDISNVLAGKSRYEARYRLQTRTGKKVSVKSIGTMVEFRGKPVNIVSFQDITAEECYKGAALRCEDQFTWLFTTQNDPSLITRVEEEGQEELIVKANRAATELLGYTEEELQHMSLGQVLPTTKEFQNRCTEQKWDEAVLYRKDGSTARTLPITHPIVMDQKPATMLILREVRGSPSLGAAGKDRHSRMMMDSILAGVMLVDAEDHRIVDINAAAASMIGTPAEELIGSCCHDAVCPAERGKCPITDLKITMDRSERVLVTADGTRRSILKSVSPFLVQGHPYLLESFVDITDRVKAEHAINQANRKLNILSSVTRHDILNQLTVLRGYLALAGDASEEAGVGEMTGPYIRQIEKAARTIRLQIEFTKDYQDIGIQAPGWHRINIILDYVTSKIDPGEVRVHNTISGLEIYTDPLITGVFYNLLDNALRHAGKLTRITVSCREVPEGLVISVSDDGDGIHSKHKKQIFERGYGKNTGYGLFIIRDILDITGITIQEIGTFGEGAEFELLVPGGGFRFVDQMDEIPDLQSEQSGIPGTPS